jgi:ABC-type antimicrobial peptide transport system permease subunit
MPPVVTMLSVGRRYFETLGARITRGRPFNDDDAAIGREGVIVNERLAQMFFAGQDPIGQRIRLVDDGMAGMRLPTLTIVGVADNLRQRITPNLDFEPIAYVHDLAIPTVSRPLALIVRPKYGEPAQLAQILRDEVRALDPDIPVVNIQTMDQSLAQQRWTYQVFGVMFASFAVIALALAAIGLYAVTAYAVKQRTQEIGVRTALGAQPSEVTWLFLRQSFTHVAAGLVIGLCGALLTGQILQSLLISTSTHDPVTLVVIITLTVLVSVIACVWPAHRAARIDPLAALRCD